VSGSQTILPNGVTYTIEAPVQADRTADSLAALNADLAAYLGPNGMTQEERDRAVTNSINELPGEFETSGALLNAMVRNDLMGRPDDYYATLSGKYRAVTTAQANQAMRTNVDPQGFTWVVVGDAAKLKPQLEKLGMPIEVVEAQ
jgi:predicted Zn-dependent peptidase